MDPAKVIIERKATIKMNDLIQQFKDLFGAYAPIENIASTIDDGLTVTTTYAYKLLHLLMIRCNRL